MKEQLFRFIPLAVELLSRVRISQPQISPLPRFHEVYMNIRQELEAMGATVEPMTTAPAAVAPSKEEEVKSGTYCLTCSDDHISTSSGLLSEAARMAVGREITDPEIQMRIASALDELNAMERVDLAPNVIARLPADEKAKVDKLLPRMRDLRHNIHAIMDLDSLREVSAQAKDLRMDVRQTLVTSTLNRQDIDKVVVLAKKVASGEMTKEEAKAELRGE